MLQALAAYALVAFAAGWVAWSILLPRKLKQKLRRWGERRIAPGEAGPTSRS